MNFKLLQSKPIFFSIILLSILSLFALFREVSDTIKVKKEIGRLEQEAHELESKNQYLHELVDYLQSDEYKERIARGQLNLQLPGEVAVALPSSKEDLGQGQTKNTISRISDSNLKNWWNYFFGINRLK